jgi:hypothetical protein
MSHDDVIPRESVRYGAYVCLRLGDAVDRRALQAAAVPALAARLGLASEFEAPEPLPRAAIAFLRRLDGRAGDIADDDVLQADGVIHVAAATRDPVAEFCDEVTRLLAPALKPRILGGVVRPLAYTGAAMNNFAYAHRVLQRPGHAMPHAFLLPMSKTAAWWAKDWMERHTYFLPRYDDAGRMTADGHALAAAAGIPCLLRRTYKAETEPAPEGAYDFVTYFECADADVPTFHRVVASLRDVRKNPEWQFVREGPTWHGQRVATWPDVFTRGS